MALIPPFFLDCVVALGIVTSTSSPTGEPTVTTNWTASGFLYGKFVAQVSPSEKQYAVYLVTNRHVLNGQRMVKLRFNPEEAQPAREYDVELHAPDGKLLWYAPRDPDIDVAIVPLNVQLLKDQHIRFHWFHSDEHVADRSKANALGVSEGDGVFTLGFPLGEIGGERNFVIVRQGAIARIRDALAGVRKEFLIDTFIFPGNSGGPVVSRPELSAIAGTKAMNAAYLLGVVKSYVSYRETAISLQTGRPRVVFEENSGLAAVVPVDFVNEAIAEYEKTQRRQ